MDKYKKMGIYAEKLVLIINKLKRKSLMTSMLPLLVTYKLSQLTFIQLTSESLRFKANKIS